MEKIKAGIVGGTGFTAGELIRILLYHPNVEISFVTSQSLQGEFVSDVHKDLFGETTLKFENFAQPADIIFLCLPHGESKNWLMDNEKRIDPETKIIDLGNDFRVDEEWKDKKFIYGLVREGGRAKDFETAIMWLSDCGLIHKISRVNSVGIPLKAYEDLKAFKLFLVDIGLLGCLTGLSGQTILYKNELFTEFKGAITEQYVCQQLKSASDLGLYYYTNDRGSCEVDFIVDTGEQVIPLEVKAEINLKAKSLKTYREKYSPRLSIRMSMADFKAEDGLINLPLYMAGKIMGKIFSE